MAKFKCIRTCWGFQRRYWVEGQEVEVDERDEQPPHHFVKIDAYVAPVAVDDKTTAAVPLSAMAQTMQPTNGMSAGLPQTSGIVTGSTVRRGRPRK